MLRTIVCLAFGLLGSSLFAQPVNDTCETATPVAEGVHDFDNFDAVTNGPTTCDANLTGDVWFLYTATFDGVAKIATCGTTGSLTDTALCVYDGVVCPTGLSIALATDDDSCGPTGFNSETSIDVIDGGMYYVQVGGWNGGEGTGTLVIAEGESCDDGVDNDLDGLLDCADPDCVSSLLCPEDCSDGVDNDIDGLVDCLDPECIGDPGCAPENDLCSSPLIIGLETVEFGTAYAGLDGPVACAIFADSDVWFRYDATFTGTLIAEGCFDASSFSSISSYLGVTCPAPTDDPLACLQGPCSVSSPAVLLTGVTAGESYLIRLAGDWSLTELGTLTLRALEPEICDDGIDNDLDGALDCIDPDCYGVATCNTYGGEANLVINPDAVDGDEGIVADATALTAALVEHGESVALVDNTVEFAYSFGIFFEPSLKNIWVTAGTFPAGEPISPAALDALLQAQENGKNVYLGSGDQWGSGPLASPYRFVDGVNDAESTSGGAVLTSVDGWDSNVGIDLSDWVDISHLLDSSQNESIDQLLPSTSFTDIGIVRAGRVLGADDALSIGDFSVVIAADTLFGGKTISSSIEFGALDPSRHHELVGRYLDHFTLPDYRRGDVNDDGLISLADVLSLADGLFGPGSTTWNCEDAADANDDGTIDVADPVFLAYAIFVPGSLLPPEPGSFNCGNDPSPDALDCAQYLGCP